MVKFSNKLVPKKSVKKWDRVKKKWDSSKFWTINQDCPSKSGTVGGYVSIADSSGGGNQTVSSAFSTSCVYSNRMQLPSLKIIIITNLTFMRLFGERSSISHIKKSLRMQMSCVN